MFQSLYVDLTKNFAYAASGTTPSYVVQFDLTTFTRAGRAPGEGDNEAEFTRAVTDFGNNMIYWGNPVSPGVVVSFNVATLSRVTAIQFNSGEDKIYSAIGDKNKQFGFFGTLTAPALVVKVALSTLTRVGAITLNTGDDNFQFSKRRVGSCCQHRIFRRFHNSRKSCRHRFDDLHTSRPTFFFFFFKKIRNSSFESTKSTKQQQ